MNGIEAFACMEEAASPQMPESAYTDAFDQIQPSSRHESGYAMRFPRIVRLRPDKPVTEIDTLETVRQIAGR